MLVKNGVENSLNRARRVLAVWLVVLAVGWQVAAIASPGEDLVGAAARGDLAAVQALLVKGADVNAKTNNDATALIVASQAGHLDVVQALLTKGAEVNAKTTSNGGTALIIASQNGHLGVVQALLAKGPRSMPRRQVTDGLH